MEWKEKCTYYIEVRLGLVSPIFCLTAHLGWYFSSFKMYLRPKLPVCWSVHVYVTLVYKTTVVEPIVIRRSNFVLRYILSSDKGLITFPLIAARTCISNQTSSLEQTRDITQSLTWSWSVWPWHCSLLRAHNNRACSIWTFTASSSSTSGSGSEMGKMSLENLLSHSRLELECVSLALNSSERPQQQVLQLVNYYYFAQGTSIQFQIRTMFTSK